MSEPSSSIFTSPCARTERDWGWQLPSASPKSTAALLRWRARREKGASSACFCPYRKAIGHLMRNLHMRSRLMKNRLMKNRLMKNMMGRDDDADSFND